MMEILAPCGGPEHLKAAVYAGADAVYIGGRNFSARRNAVNFGREELSEAVRFCREYGVKVYVTVNILTRDNEMQDMEKYIYELAEAAPDALIVQDVGVASLCKRIVPGLPLHASTQMSVHTPEGVRFCADAGFTRVVIARECSREELERITLNAPIEIETFVHGALCVSVSGQCTMSAVIGRRSGNRGLCAQPCRLAMSTRAPQARCQPQNGDLPYDRAMFGDRPQNGVSPYPLSLKDLSLINEIPVLQKMGVAAIKIEGRMKRPEYVAAAVTACRAVLNGGKADMDGLRAVFSREGFTQGYFAGNFADMNGTRVAEDAGKSANALAAYAELIRTPRRRTPVNLTFNAEDGKPMSLTVSFAESMSTRKNVRTDICGSSHEEIFRLTSTVYGDIPEPALNRVTSADEIRKRLERLGGTPFEVGKLAVNIGEGLFIPVSKINAMRQDACSSLIAKRVKMNTPDAWASSPRSGRPAPDAWASSPRSGRPAPDAWASSPPVLRVHCENIVQTEAALAFKDTQVVVNLSTAFSLSKDNCNPDRIILTPGRFILDEAQLLIKLKELCSVGFSRILCQNPAHILLGKQAGFKKLHGGMGLNIFNSESAAFFLEAGLADVTVSMELSLTECRAMTSNYPVGLAVYGKLPLMLLRRCPFGRCPFGRDTGNCGVCPGRLTDRTKRGFTVACRGGYRELLNADVLWMADRLNELRQFAFHSIYLYEETPEETRAVIGAYMNGGKPPKNFTRGLLYRGVE